MNPARPRTLFALHATRLHDRPYLVGERIEDGPILNAEELARSVHGGKALITQRPFLDVGRPRLWARLLGWRRNGFVGREAVVAALEAGHVVGSNQRYGTAYVWRRSSDGILRGELIQYREVTENETFPTAIAAARWLERMYMLTQR